LHRIKSNGTEIGPILLGGLSDPHSPSYSADGRWIVFSARLDGQYDLFRVAPDGARLRRLTNTPERDRYAAVSPGNRMIAFACGPALCRIKPDGTRRRVLFDPNDFHTVRSIDFFPSGRSLVFLFENAEYGFLSLRTIRASGKGIRTMRLSRQELEGGSFDLSADGRRLVIADDGQLGVMKLSRNRRHALWVRAIRTPSGERFADPAWLVPRG
jgi:Tol biopolymer transport system component